MTTSDTIRETEAIHSNRRERAEARAIDEASGIGRRLEGSLRFAVSAMDRQMSLLATQATTEEKASTVGGLLSRWAELLDQLALGPAPDVRSCPVCGHVGMSAATLCGYCWARLSPIPRRAARKD
jgi:hypothetical protein